MTADLERLHTFVRQHQPANECKRDSGHCRCLLCVIDEMTANAVLTVDEASAVYHLLTQRGVSSILEPVLYALRQRLSHQVRITDGIKPRPFAWRVP